MKIGTVEQTEITKTELKVKERNNKNNYWDIRESVHVTNSNEPKYYILTIEIYIDRITTDHNLNSIIKSVFKVSSDTPNFVPTSDNDFYFFADLIQISRANARFIFNDLCEKAGMQKQFLRIDPIQKIYLDVKNGNISVLN